MMEKYLRDIDREKGGPCVFHRSSPAAISNIGFPEETCCWLSELSFKDIPKGRCIIFARLGELGPRARRYIADCGSDSAALPGYGDDRHGFVPAAGCGTDRCVGGDVPQGIERPQLLPASSAEP